MEEQLMKTLTGSLNYQNQIKLLEKAEVILDLIKLSYARAQDRIAFANSMNKMGFTDLANKKAHDAQIAAMANRRLRAYYRKTLHQALNSKII